ILRFYPSEASGSASRDDGRWAAAPAVRISYRDRLLPRLRLCNLPADPPEMATVRADTLTDSSVGSAAPSSTGRSVALGQPHRLCPRQTADNVVSAPLTAC